MKEWFKNYFRAFIKQAPPNLKVGDTMTFGIRYMDKDGKWGKMHVMDVIHKKDL